jgi:proline dehydrogenase
MSMLRSLFIYLSRQRWLRHLILALGITRRASRRFVAGDTAEETIEVIRQLNRRGILATLDHLGEDVHTEADARQARDDYVDALELIRASGAAAHVSIKLTQFGLDVSGELCRELVSSVAEKAAQVGAFVRIDMEGSPHTDRTLAVYRDVRQQHSNVGIVLQAYLYRTENDVKQLVDEGIATIRLCKGAYQEPPTLAFPRKADVDANMVKLMRFMLDDEARAKGARLAMATHDVRMIAATKSFVAERNISKDAFEFQMLFGIRRDLQQQLAAEGYKMRVYVPYGTEWYPYFMRRLAERPANVGFVLSNLLRS